MLPLGEGVVLDPFAGSGSTLAAANFVGYESIGVEKDPAYYQMALKSHSRPCRACGKSGKLRAVAPGEAVALKLPTA